MNENNNFWMWFKIRLTRPSGLATAFLSCLAALLAGGERILSLLPAASKNAEWNWFALSLAIQAAVIFGLLIVVWRPPRLKKRMGAGPLKAVKAFHVYWCWIWMTWFFFYGAMAYFEFASVQVNNHAFGQWPLIIETALGNIASVLFLLCFLIVYQRRADSQLWLPWLAAFIAVSVAIICAGANSMPELKGKFQWISCLMGSVTMALLVGRIESKLIGLPLTVMIPLYLYSALQALPVAVPQFAYLKFPLYTAALFLKCLLFAVVYWLLSSGTLAYYFARSKGWEPGAAADRARFLR